MFKAIFWDIKLVYKNFVHWNISKVLIFLSSIWLWILLSLPFFIIAVIIAYLDPINWKEVLYPLTSWTTIPMWLYMSFFQNIWFFILEIVLFILAIWMIYFWYSYKTLLFSKLNLSYINWEKLPYKENDYFNFKLIWAYFWVLWWGGLILFIPIIVFLVLFWILVFSLGWINSVVNLTNWWINTFTVLSLILFIITTISFIYLSYKITFSFINIVDSKRFPKIEKNTRVYIKDSFKISWGIKILKFILMLLILWLILLPFNYLRDVIIVNIYTYIWYTLFMFLAFTWLFEMLVVSLYKRVMLWDWEKVEENKKEVNKETDKKEEL